MSISINNLRPSGFSIQSGARSTNSKIINWLCGSFIASLILLGGGAKAAPAPYNVLVNPGAETGDLTGWNVSSTGYTLVVSTNSLVPNTTDENILAYGKYVFEQFDTTADSAYIWQDYPAVAGSQWSANCWAICYASNYFDSAIAYMEVAFFDTNNNLLGASFDDNIGTCPAPFQEYGYGVYGSAILDPNATLILGGPNWIITPPPAVDTSGWMYLPATNFYYGYTNFGIGDVPIEPGFCGFDAIEYGYQVTTPSVTTNLVAPPGTAYVRYKLEFDNGATDGGAVYWDDCVLAKLTWSDPDITNPQPASVTITNGEPASFTVHAIQAHKVSIEMLTYQWQKNGTNLPAAGGVNDIEGSTTNATLYFTNCVGSDAGQFDVVVRGITTNTTPWSTNGTIRSVPVTLTVLIPPPPFTNQFTYITNNGTITITGFTGPGGDVTIPDTINGYPVTSIGNLAFAYCTNLTGVTIGDSVTSIGDYAFYSCTSLTSVTIGNGVTSIGDGAFLYCSSLTAITVAALNPAYSSADGILFDKNQTLLIQCPGGEAGIVVIPNGVTSIGDEAFLYCANLTGVTIPNTVTSIGDEAFELCSSLTTVLMSSNLTSIGNYAFHDCYDLTNVTIPNSVTSIGDEAFAFCYDLTSITIPNGVTSIGDGAFFYCSSLTSVTIPNSVTSIGNSAFSDCSGLTNATIPDSVTSLGISAFFYCSSLTGITIPNSVTNIGVAAFAYCSGLTGVYFMGNAPSIGMNVFLYDNNATVYYLPGTSGWGPTFGGLPTALWTLPYPLILNNGPSFGVQTNGFGFIISWATNISVVVEACTNLANPVWQPIQTNTLTGGSSYFSDPQWTNYPSRFYSLSSP